MENEKYESPMKSKSEMKEMPKEKMEKPMAKTMVNQKLEGGKSSGVCYVHDRKCSQ